MRWSVDGQTPEYLALTRMVSLAPEVIERVLECTPLCPGMRVLDVGCGSGEYVFRLGHATRGVEYVGLDYDQNFVDVANARAQANNASNIDISIYEPANPQNTYEFVQGDGLHLPFENDEFDAVISHTYLTAMPDYQTALAEMIRVCKPGGTVSSITNMNNNFSGTGAGSAGAFELFAPLLDPKTLDVVQRVQNLRDTKVRYIDMGSGVPTYKVQRLFAHLLLEGVSAQPLSHYFCLSDARTSMDAYIKFVDLLYDVEVKRTRRMQKIPCINKKLSADEWNTYYSALEKRHEDLIGMLGAGNQEWTWYGNTSLLVWGRVPDKGSDPGLNKFCERVCEERAGAEKLREQTRAAGYKIHERYAQAGPGRVCTVQLRHKKRVVYASEFNTSLAFEEAYEALRGLHKKQRKRCEDAQECAWKKIQSALDAGNLEKSKHIKPLDDKSIYCIDLMWDSVAETIEAGYSVKFYEVDCAKKPSKKASKKTSKKASKKLGEKAIAPKKHDKEMHVIYVRCTRADSTLHGICAHPDSTIATRRAFSRAIAQSCPAFR